MRLHLLDRYRLDSLSDSLCASTHSLICIHSVIHSLSLRVGSGRDPVLMGHSMAAMALMPGQGQPFGSVVALHSASSSSSACSGVAVRGLFRSTTAVSTWECAVCTYSNDALKSSCIMCGLSRDNAARPKGGGRPHSDSSTKILVPAQAQNEHLIHFTFPNKVALPHLLSLFHSHSLSR